MTKKLEVKHLPSDYPTAYRHPKHGHPVERLMRRLAANKCECGGKGFIPVAVDGGEDTEYVECAKHHPAYQDVPTVDELINHLGRTTGLRI